MTTVKSLQAFALTVAMILLASGSARGQEQAFGWARFEQYLESLRQQAGIPGLSAAVVKDRQIVWERGFGFRDLEAGLRAEPDTPYHVVGLTQVFGATLLLDCVEHGRLTLDAPASRFTTAILEPGATLFNLLTHTSEGIPGTAFQFNLTRYAALTPAIESCWGGQPFREILTTQVLDRLAMTNSIPGQDVLMPDIAAQLQPTIFDPIRLERYRSIAARLARPYSSDASSRPSPAIYPANTLDAASGLITTVRDLARFDAALDDRVLLDDATVAAMWTAPLPRPPLGPVQAEIPAPLPHALGWFVQQYQGERIVWQFGRWPDVTSSIIVKVPSHDLTFILLANSDGIAAASQFEAGDITTSLFVRLFLRFFL
jgi:CubicO group peptidase (beta-lactamase class C family)